MKIISVIVSFASVFLCGCEQKAQLPSNTSSVPSLSTNEMTQTGAKADPASYMENRGYTLDLNGDGINDFVIMNNNVLIWKRSGQGADVSLITVGFPVHAYGLRIPPSSQRIALYVYDDKDFEHYSENLGNSPDGTPIFGALEASK